MRIATVVVGVVLTLSQAAPFAADSLQDTTVYRPGSGVTDPVLVRQVGPKYTREAMVARIEGVVELEVVVKPDGTVGDVRVTKSLDSLHGLDGQSVEAVRQWLFKPGTLAGKPVAVAVTTIFEFRLGSGSGGSSARIIPVAQEDQFARGAYRTGTPDLVDPKVSKHVAPKYTSEAMHEKIQGVVELEAVVLEDGSVGRARVTKSLDKQYGLDDSALQAALQYQFLPGTLAGKPVPVLVTLVVEFRLHRPALR